MSKVVVGMSGGVDSAVAAYLLREQGYEVIGVTMRVWQEEDSISAEDIGGCCGLSAVEDARRVASQLDIPYYVLNFKTDFRKSVIDYFVDEYEHGRTPNPCIACNRYVKWESLLHKAVELGADYIATGHYARIEKYPPTRRLALRVSATIEKDQTYALYSLTQSQLEKTLFPIGDFTKTEIRQIASDIGLPVANKPDSQEICFVPDHDHARFIEDYTGRKAPEGHFVEESGRILGRHQGIIHYTVGQRKGLGIALGKPMFVKKIDAKRNEVILAEEPAIFHKEITVADINFMASEKPDGIPLHGKIRYAHKGAACRVHTDGSVLRCVFEEPQRAATPGQAAVFYNDGFVVCGGVMH